MFFSLPVFMYHSISRHRQRICVPPLRFEMQCAALAESGWRGISLEEAEHFFLHKKPLPAKSCLFTFDDGYFDNYFYAEPILKKYGHQGVIAPVVSLMLDLLAPRPNSIDVLGDTAKRNGLPDIHKRPRVYRNNLWVDTMAPCSWSEIQQLQSNGTFGFIGHSMRHDVVSTGPEFSRLLKPRTWASFFDIPPYDLPWGFPLFPFGHSLASRAFIPDPRLFDLVRSLVPQKGPAVGQFLSIPANVDAVVKAIRALPSLGRMESEQEHRRRIAEDFRQCREILTSKLGSPPKSFCWPWGSYTRIALEEAMKVGFQMFFHTGHGTNLAGNALTVHRIAIRPEHKGSIVTKALLGRNPVIALANGLVWDCKNTSTSIELYNRYTAWQKKRTRQRAEKTGKDTR